MNDLVALVKIYQKTESLKERLKVATTIIEEVYPAMFAFVLSQKLGDETDDVFQEILLAITNAMPRFEGNSDSEFWGYCYRIARNKVADCLRTKERRRTQAYDPADLEKVIDAAFEGEAVPLYVRQDAEFALSIFTASNDLCRELLQRRYIEQDDYKTIAVTFDLGTEDAARMRIVRCLQTANGLLTKHA